VYLPIRDALVGMIHPAFTTQFPDLPIVWDNQPFDRNAQPERFVEVSVEFLDAAQVALGLNPKTRVNGTVCVTYVCRSGLGAREALAVLDWFSTFLKYRVLGSLQLREPRVNPGDAIPGWYTPTLHVPFHVDA
jgi:hypothetical protein